MNRKEMNYLNMFKSLEVFLTDNAALLTSYEPIVTIHNKLKLAITDIESLGKTQSTDTKTQSALKAELKESLDENVLKVTAAMSAIAAQRNDTELRMVSDVEKSHLTRLREADYAIKIQKIYEAALPLVAELAKWGVTEDDINLLAENVCDFDTRTPAIRNTKVVTKQASAEVKQKITDTNNLLKLNLDALMKPFKTINPTFYGQYMNARQVLEVAARQHRGGEPVAAVE